MRQRDPLTIEEARELDALERALAGDPVDYDLREFEDLVSDIRATAPEMTPGFAARLEHQVQEGFPESQEQPALRKRRRLLVLLPAAGTVAAMLIALVVVLGQGPDDELSTFAGGDTAVQQDAPTAATESRGETLDATGAADEAASTQESARAKAAPAPPASGATGSSTDPAAAAPAIVPRASGQTVAPARERKVERSADLVLSVPMSKLNSTADGVIRTVDRFNGIVASSAIGSDDNTGEASFDLRIPTDRLDDALAALSKLGHVAERRQNLVDITGSFTSVQDNLSDARAERRGLLKALGSAGTQQQIDSLKARLRNVRSRIARLNGDLESLRRRADLSRVSVTVRGDGSKADEDTGGAGRWSPGDAARDALRVLEVAAGVALVALAVAVPLALLAALGALGVRSTRRRRREGALDPA
jgi:hypothetical protein